MCRTELRYKSIRLALELRQSVSREGLQEMLETWGAVIRASRSGSTYATELRIHLLAGLLALFALLPFQLLSAFQVFKWPVPESIWALGMFVVASHGGLQMFRTRGDTGANEEGRARALVVNCAAFVFLSVLQMLTSWERPGTVIFPFVSCVAASMALRLAKYGP